MNAFMVVMEPDLLAVVRAGPWTRPGRMVTLSHRSSAPTISHAAFSATVLEYGYGWWSTELVVFQSASVNGPRPFISMLSPWIATTLLVRTTRFTDGVALTLDSTLRVPSSAGRTS